MIDSHAKYINWTLQVLGIAVYLLNNHFSKFIYMERQVQ